MAMKCNEIVFNIPVEIDPMGLDPPVVDTECGALRKSYKMARHQEM